MTKAALASGGAVRASAEAALSSAEALLVSPEAVRAPGGAVLVSPEAVRAPGGAVPASAEGGAAAVEPGPPRGELSLVRTAPGQDASRERRPASEVLRRALDIVVAATILIALAPLLALIALVVRIDSRGPALFRQRRVGRGRREFTILKFRTMYSDADSTPHREYVQALIGDDRSPERGRLYKLSVDDRVTRIGRVLRSWSLDELPQLLNVLRGQMALVGPRPVIPYEVEMYPAVYLSRFDVKPGLTGLWQVSGRNERTYEEMVSFDVQYARSASLLLDLRILVKTVPVVFGRRGVA